MQHADPIIQLPEVALTDWLTKLGEPAFVAWLRFRTWREKHLPIDSSILLKIPIRQIIKKLRVANNTFYTKILTPLWEHGLIDLKRSQKDRRLIYLIVHPTPQYQPEKQSLDSKPCSPAKFETITPDETSSFHLKEQTASYMIKNKEDRNKEEMKKENNHDDQISLPFEIQAEINNNPKLQSQIAAISAVYERWKNDPHFVLPSYRK